MSDADTRAQILDAAERLFARQGFAATSIKQLGAEAGVNPALLYYYFGDKERLYHAVFERLLGQLARRAVARLSPPATPEAAVRGLILEQVEILLDHPHLPKLITRELVDHDASHAIEQVHHMAATAFRGLADAIRAGQADGRFRADLEPSFAAISVIAQVAYFFMARPLVGIVLGGGPDGPSPAQARAFARHAADFALAGLAAPAGGRPSRPRSRRAR